MAKDVKVFMQNCLRCAAAIPEDKVPRPLGAQLHATKPSEILHFDYLCIGLSRVGKYQYLLLLKDDLSGYLWPEVVNMIQSVLNNSLSTRLNKSVGISWHKMLA
jgi:hypothetical protein